MKNNTLIIVVAAVGIIAVVYISGSINKADDQVVTKKTNGVETELQMVYSEIALQDTDLILEIPDSYALCQFESDEFFPGLKAYAWSDGTCNHTHDAPDIQIFIFDNNLDIEDEVFLRDQAKSSFTSAGDGDVTTKDQVTYSLLNGTFVGVTTSIKEDYRLYVQANIGPPESNVQEASMHILQTVKRD